jgi:hypothetical protein
MTDDIKMMTLGDFRFSVNTAAYQQLRRTMEYRWPAQARAGRSDARQFTGVGSESFALSGVIYPHYRSGSKQLDTLRALAGKGLPQILTSGTGKAFGKFCIERVEETQTVFFSNGTFRKQEFSLTLTAYGEDI